MQMLENFNYEKQTQLWHTKKKQTKTLETKQKQHTRETFSAKIRLKYIIKEKQKKSEGHLYFYGMELTHAFYRLEYI